MRKLLNALLLLAVALSASGQGSLATNSPGGAPLSTRVVAYTLDAKIDTNKKALDATETLTYRNLTGQPLSSFPFHLYLNAFRPESSFTSETHFGGGIRDNIAADSYPDRKLGSILVSSLSADGYGDLLPQFRYAAPDDGNRNDHTVAVVTLPHPVAPGDSITFRMRFHDQFPESVARNGWKRDFLMGGQWFPKVGVFWHGAWNCHQYHATTEFFSDFGTYNVRLTLPERFTVGATGVPTADQTNPDGTRTLGFYAEDVIDFAWAASPNFTVTTGTYLGSMGPVQVRVLALKAHPHAGARYLKILLGSLDQFDRRYGPYPYKVLTMIDPEPGSEIGGMEYPTLITGDTSNFDLTETTEITAEHEFGHQYWYAMVATNEFEDAWLDEGINSYTETIVTGALLGRDTSALGLKWANMSDTELQYLQYTSDPTYDPVTRFAWKFRNANSYGAVTYGKSATLLHQLENEVGHDTMAEAMRTYFLRFRFQHPTTEDFLTTIEEVAIRRGRATGMLVTAPAFAPVPGVKLADARPTTIVNSSLRPFINQAVYGTAVLDYSIDSVHSGPAEWWKANPFSRNKDVLQRDTVTVHRIGDFRTPVTVEVVFTDGTRVREQWAPGDGADANTRWHTWTYLRNAGVASAEVDPDHLLTMDRDPFNNSYTVKANPIPARKLGTLYSSFLQFATQVAGWLV